MSATRHGQPGEWAKARGTVMSLWPLFVCFAALGAFASAAVLELDRYAAWFAGAFIVTVVLTATLWHKGLYRIQSYFKGARGEERVAGLLEKLPTGWHVFHDFHAGKFHVDHVVLGPVGVYAVETKNWRGRVTVEEGEVLVDGALADRSPLRQAAQEANAVRTALKQAGWNDLDTVEAVLCLASDTCAVPEQEVRHVNVLNACELTAWLQRRPAMFTASAVERLAQLLETHTRA